jgi:two-component system LytT family response regulator
MISCFILGGPGTVEKLSMQIEKFLLTTLSGHSLLPDRDLSKVLGCCPKIVFVEDAFIGNHKRALTGLAQKCTVIYISPTTEHAFEAFDAQGFDYLLEPVCYERFEMSINKFIRLSLVHLTPHASILKKVEPITESFFIKADSKGQKEILIKCGDIVFIKAMQNYVLIYMRDDRQVISHHTMREMEENLPASYFQRVHKSYIINYERISSVNGNTIVLDHRDQFQFMIGNSYRKVFFERKNQKMIKKSKGSFQYGFSAGSA